MGFRNFGGGSMGILGQLAEPIATTVPQAVFDGATVSAKDAASHYELTDLRLSIAAAMMQLAETSDSDLGDNESLVDRFDALLFGVIDMDKDGEVSDEEAELFTQASEIAAEWLSVHGASEQDIEAIINDGDEEALENVIELLKDTLPDGEDSEHDAINDFGGLGSKDSGVFDAAYAKKVAFRNGKKVVIKKRISGTVRMSAKQKAALAKARRKSHSGAARLRRQKTMNIRRKAGM